MLIQFAILMVAVLPAFQETQRAPVAIDLKGASSAEHIWFAAADIKDSQLIRLYHHATGMGGPYYRTPTILPRMPSAMAASGDSAWLVFDPQPNQAEAKRDVYTIRAERSPATGIFFYVPDKVPKLVEPLPADGALTGFAAGPEGPLALLTPFEWTEAGVDAGPGRGITSTMTRPRLLALRGGSWIDLVAPPLAEGDRATALVTDQRGRLVRVLAQRRTSGRQALIVYESGPDENWTMTPIDLTARRVDVAGAQGSRLLLTLSAEGAAIGEPTGFRIGFLRHERFIPLGAVASGRDALLVAGTARDIRVIRATRDGGLKFQHLDSITGRASEPVEMAGQPLSTASRVYFPLLVTVFTTALLLAIMIRPVAPDGERNKPHVEPAPFGPRILALLADLAPSAIVALAVTGNRFPDLLNFPLWATTLDESLAIIAAALLTALHCAVGEAIWSTSFGKAIVGLRVVRLDGRRPRLWQIAVRNLFKVVCIIMPPLAVFALLNPHRQRLGDAVARTIVTHAEEPGADDAPPADSDDVDHPAES